MIRLVPVFVIKTPPKAEQNPVDVMLMGIFWKAVEGDDNTWIVSPIRNVEMPRTELGPSRICDSARRMPGPLGRKPKPYGRNATMPKAYYAFPAGYRVEYYRLFTTEL